MKLIIYKLSMSCIVRCCELVVWLSLWNCNTYLLTYIVHAHLDTRKPLGPEWAVGMVAGHTNGVMCVFKKTPEDMCCTFTVDPSSGP